jgi:hypothetical protein
MNNYILCLAWFIVGLIIYKVIRCMTVHDNTISVIPTELEMKARRDADEARAFLAYTKSRDK